MSGRNDHLADGDMPLIDDIDLSAYLDGEARPGDRRRIADAIESAPGFARKAQLLRNADAKARQYGDALLASAPPARLCVRRMVAERRAKRTRRLVAAGVVLTIAFLSFVGGWIGHGLFHQQTFIARSFVEDAAAPHTVFSVETHHPVEVTALESGHLTAWLSKRLNIPVTQADLSGAGFKFIGGRLLSSRSGAPAAMLMYQDAEGIRATLYLARNRGAEPSSFRFFSSSEGRTESVYWFDRDISYGLTGAYNRETLLKLAKGVLKAMDGA